MAHGNKSPRGGADQPRDPADEPNLESTVCGDAVAEGLEIALEGGEVLAVECSQD
jgi:hypothetical protein